MFCNKCGAAISNDVSVCEKCGEQVMGSRNAITYDYLAIQAEGKAAYEVVDSYQALGWEAINRESSFIPGLMTINFRRNRKVKNKEQLNRLQTKLDDCFNGIKVCEKNKTQTAMVFALILGVIGAIIFGGGMSMILTITNPELWVYIVGGILALIGAVPCALAYFVYNRIRVKKTAAMNILIEGKRDEIDNLCDDAQRFL